MQTAVRERADSSTSSALNTVLRHLRRVGERLLWGGATLLALATLVFALVRTLPGDPAITILGEFATPERVERTREMLGLDDPIYIQYADYLRQVVTGDFGNSFRNGVPVTDLLSQAIMPTLILAAAATAIAVVFGVIAGLIAAMFRGRFADSGLLAVSVVFISVPNFWFGLALIFGLADAIPLFPATGTGTAGDFQSQLHALILPAVALSTGGAAMISRVARSSILEVIGEDYLVVARAVGIRERVILPHFALRNALPAILGSANVVFAICVANAVVIEAVFSRRGLGSAVLDATLARDYPVIQGGLLAIAAVIVATSILVDLLYPLIEPRNRP